MKNWEDDRHTHQPTSFPILVEKHATWEVSNEDPNFLIGFYSLKYDAQARQNIELSLMNVEPDCHRREFGAQLFKRLVEKSKHLQKTRLFWISDPDAAGFYEKMGAKQFGTDENLWPQREGLSCCLKCRWIKWSRRIIGTLHFLISSLSQNFLEYTPAFLRRSLGDRDLT